MGMAANATTAAFGCASEPVEARPWLNQHRASIDRGGRH